MDVGILLNLIIDFERVAHVRQLNWYQKMPVFYCTDTGHDMGGSQLTAKRQAFIAEYLKCWNATEAARRAGYRYPNKQGPALVNLGIVAEAIKARLAEKAMTADEVLARLAEQARAEHMNYLQPDGEIDLARLLADGKGHLVKGTKWDKSGNLVVEFYDGQRALELLGKHLGLFKDGVQVDISDALAGILERLADQGGTADD